MLDPKILRLVAITDDAEEQRTTLVDRVAAAVRGGATSVQVRLKHATPREVVEIAKAIVARVPVPVIVNDRADIALAAGAAGVHVGEADLRSAPSEDLRPRISSSALRSAATPSCSTRKMPITSNRAPRHDWFQGRCRKGNRDRWIQTARRTFRATGSRCRWNYRRAGGSGDGCGRGGRGRHQRAFQR